MGEKIPTGGREVIRVFPGGGGYVGYPIDIRSNFYVNPSIGSYTPPSL